MYRNMTHQIALTEYLAWYHSKASFINTCRTELNGQLFADDIFNCIFLNKNCHDFIQISLKPPFDGPADKKSSLVYVMTDTEQIQVITLRNDDPVYWCLHASRGQDKLTIQNFS